MKQIPAATYRLQCNSKFTLDDAHDLLPYFERLGITDLYTSPLFMTGGDDLNGYEVTDHSRLNPNTGSEEDLSRLSEGLKERKMGLIADIVPNHMAISYATNKWWNDVLENGPSSPFASYFDIDWHPPRAELAGKVLLPILGDLYGNILDRNELTLNYKEGTFTVDYWDRALPTDPSTWTGLLEPVVAEMEGSTSGADEALASIVTALQHLPTTAETDPDLIAERHREVGVIKKRLAEIPTTVIKAIEHHLCQVNQPDALDQFLNLQPYRLSFWRVANHEINYRRFFDVNDLAGLRIESFEVFSKVHDYLFSLVRRGWITGLRVDHVDGLVDPEQYLAELQMGCSIALSPEEEGDFYILVEKIFTGAEQLRQSWPVAGTTGYDFLNQLNGLFVDPTGSESICAIYKENGGSAEAMADLVYQCKRLILNVALASELSVLARQLDRISEKSRYSRDFTLENLQAALCDVIACFPVYRSYVRAEDESIEESDRHYITSAIKEAKKFNPAMSNLIYEFIEQILLTNDFVAKFQQLTGPVMAKGVEDTAFYRYYPLASLNEVGGEPHHFGTSIDDFHRQNIERLEKWPHTMTTTSTHDTKRSEDVRARINVLSEMPDQWRAALLRWHTLSQTLDIDIGGNETYLLYQTLVGSWPSVVDDLYIERIQSYMHKATKEAKVHTSWINPDSQFDQALHVAVEQMLRYQPLVDDISAFVGTIARAGMFNSLAQVVLKTCAPGVPDFYQGSELWQFTLVDPDNRQPIDYALRQQLAAQPVREDLLEGMEDGWIKLHATTRALNCRRRNAALFREGDYLPLAATGTHADKVVAFARRHEGKWVLCAAGRFFTQFDQWGDTALSLPFASGTYQELVSGRAVPIGDGQILAADLFGQMPVAMIEGGSHVAT